MNDAARLTDMLRASPRVMSVLCAARELAIPDPLLVSGAVYQTAWNALTGRDRDYGVKDYDLTYFDPDVSWDAEDAWIRRVAAAFDPPLREAVEVRNQARVHLWFNARFGGEPYPPLACTAESLERFVCPAFSVGARLEADGELTIVAPFGLDDLFAMRLRPNPNRELNPDAFARTTGSVKARWPELTVEG